MMTTMVVTKSTGLAKTDKGVREFGARVERARQAHNEKIARAAAEYIEAVRRAVEAVTVAEETPTSVEELEEVHP